MEKNLAKDLTQQDDRRVMLLQEREEMLSLLAKEPRHESRLGQMIRLAQFKIQQKNEAVQAYDQSYMLELAEEVKVGNDQLHRENSDNVERLYAQAKEV